MYKRLIAGAVVLSMIALSQVAEASFIQPDAGTTDGGIFNSTYPIENLWGGADDSVAAGTDTINSLTANGGNGYASANPPAGGYPVTITLDFTVAQELSAFYLWNSNGGANANPTLRGIKDFSLKFWDGAGGSGTQIGTTYSSTAAKALWGGDVASEAFVFPSSYVGVSSVELIIATNHNTQDWVGAREIGFEVIPEPATLGLVALFGGGLLFIRRKLAI